MDLKLQDLVVVVAHKEMQVDQQIHLLLTTLVVEAEELELQEQHQLTVLQELLEELVVMVYQVVLQGVVLHMLVVVEVVEIQLHLEHQVDQVVEELVDINQLIMQPQELQTPAAVEEELVELQILVELMAVQE